MTGMAYLLIIGLFLVLLLLSPMAVSTITDMHAWSQRTFRERAAKEGGGYGEKLYKVGAPAGDIIIGDPVGDYSSDASGDMVIALPAAFSAHVVRQVLSVVNDDPARTVHFAVLSLGTGTFTLRVRDGADALLNSANVLTSWTVLLTPP